MNGTPITHRRIGTATRPPMRERNPAAEVTPAAEALIARALAKDPAARHADMSELLAELQGCYGDENFLRNVEQQARADEARAPRPRSLTEDLKDLFAVAHLGGALD